jgi:hypothetical protein
LGCPLEIIEAAVLSRTRLSGIVEVFPTQKKVVGSVWTQRRIDRIGPWNLGDCRTDDENEKCERSFQDAGSFVRFGAFAK